MCKAKLWASIQANMGTRNHTENCPMTLGKETLINCDEDFEGISFCDKTISIIDHGVPELDD